MKIKFTKDYGSNRAGDEVEASPERARRLSHVATVVEDAYVAVHDEMLYAEGPVSAQTIASAPKPYAAKGDWVTFAMSLGLNKDEAEGMTKSDLVARFGGN